MSNRIQKRFSHLSISIMPPLISYIAVICMVSALFLPFCNEVRAQDPLELEETTVQTPAEQWGFALTPYAWFAAQSSDVGG